MVTRPLNCGVMRRSGSPLVLVAALCVASCAGPPRIVVIATAETSVGDIGFWRNGQFHLDAEQDPKTLRLEDFQLNLTREDVASVLAWLAAQTTIQCADSAAESFDLDRADGVLFEQGGVTFRVYVPSAATEYLFRREAGMSFCERSKPYDPNEEIVVTSGASA